MIDALIWPLNRLGEALEVLARLCGLQPRSAGFLSGWQDLKPGKIIEQNAGQSLGPLVEAIARHLGFEAEPIEITYRMVERLLPRAGPAVFLLPPPREHYFLALLPRKRGKGKTTLSFLGPDHNSHVIKIEIIRQALCRELESHLAAEVHRLLQEAEVPAGRQIKTKKAVLSEHLGPTKVCNCWLLRLPPGASFWHQMLQQGLPGYLLAFIGAQTIQYIVLILAWIMVGRGALQGRFDMGCLLAWALLLLTMVPFQMVSTWIQGILAINVGGLLKQRLLYGALRLEPEDIRHKGAGQLLSQVMESEAVESLALSSGFMGLSAGVELISATIVLGLGPGGRSRILLFLGWIIFSCVLGWGYFFHRRHWTQMRLDMTHDLVERMVGHRTRLAQERRDSWHDGEDQTLERYLNLSHNMDALAARLTALIPEGWLVLGFFGLAPAFISGQSSVSGLAVALGGILLAYRALGKLPMGFMTLSDTIIAWKQVAPLYRAAGRSSIKGSPSSAIIQSAGSQVHEEKHPVLEANNLSFRYHDRSEPVILGCSLQVFSGDKLLLEGPSGCGKSTLASLLIGLRTSRSGLLLLQGLDLPTLGPEGWRRKVVTAPQFHENHIFTGPLAFNLLMGRCWPPQSKDVRDAENICRQLGLGELLDRMPCGLMQIVGETGWQLSHGEKSRLYIARALLQGADFIILDESFAALDPESLHQALCCVLDRAHTLLVIAHP